MPTKLAVDFNEAAAIKHGWLIRFLRLDRGTSKAIMVGNRLYCEVSRASADTKMYQALNLPEVYNTQINFEVLHIWMIMRRLIEVGDEGMDVNQHVFDRMWEHQDRRLYEVGVGVLKKSKYIETLQKHFYNAVGLYDKSALGKDNELSAALWELLFQRRPDCEAAVTSLVRYVRDEQRRLKKMSTEEALEGRFMFDTSKLYPP